MKKAIIAITCLISLNVFGGEPKNEHPDKYCCKPKAKSGELCVMHQGKEITTAAKLSDGSKVEPNGTVTRKDGSKVLLKDGQCIDKEGKIAAETPMEKK